MSTPKLPYIVDGRVTQEWLDAQDLRPMRDLGVHNALVREVRAHRETARPPQAWSGPRIVVPAKPSRVRCDACGATIEYMPEDVKSSTGYGDFESAVVECPRPKCTGVGTVD